MVLCGLDHTAKDSWVPDLCSHGDVHPNPGPRRKAESLAVAQIVSLNVQSAKNAWKVLED